MNSFSWLGESNRCLTGSNHNIPERGLQEDW